ncbi:uncharacterized protein LOC104417970 [Eucalyptus grandis]|uniref:uncharacterized protein LOC104417970 n=1 Tax=Eucalyptus grandis TaxID=71139 RepID=UPI00192E9D7A|nr:uncharacterized protein LOC104417970 [Eucalyptus grandis]
MSTGRGHVVEYHTDGSEDGDVEGCEELNYSIYDGGYDGVAREDGFAFVDLDELYMRNVSCANKDGSMERDMEVGDISQYVDVLADNVDFLNMNGENEYTHPEFNAEVDMENPVFKLGMCFSNAEEFRKAVRNHAIKNGRKVRALHVPQISTKWLANKYCDRLRNNPTWPGASMKKTMESENVLKLSRTMVYRARATAMSMITGNEEEQFRMLRSYCQALLDANPGSTCIIKTEQYQDQYKFKAVYICLDALRRGFVEGCRRFVGFDGCHLSSGYRGILLAAVGIDGNNQMYPFAWAVVGQETYKTWHWFISLIIEDLGITDPENSKYWTFLCDKRRDWCKH